MPLSKLQAEVYNKNNNKFSTYIPHSKTCLNGLYNKENHSKYDNKLLKKKRDMRKNNKYLVIKYYSQVDIIVKKK